MKGVDIEPDIAPNLNGSHWCKTYCLVHYAGGPYLLSKEHA